jgi:hypothetical protein
VADYLAHCAGGEKPRMNPMHRDTDRSAGLHLFQELSTLGQQFAHTLLFRESLGEVEAANLACLRTPGTDMPAFKYGPLLFRFQFLLVLGLRYRLPDHGGFREENFEAHCPRIAVHPPMPPHPRAKIASGRRTGKNYERLAKIKKRYDPAKLFRINQNIKPA